MTDDELVEQATAALRETTRADTSDASEGIARLLAARAKRPGRFRPMWLPLLAAASVFVAAGALAGTQKGVREWVTSLGQPEGVAVQSAHAPKWTGSVEKAARASASTARGAHESVASQLSRFAEESEPLDEALEPQTTPKRPLAFDEGRPPVPTEQEPSPRAPEQEAVDSDVLFREAHRLHFKEQRFSAALGAWDTYLRVAPAGDRWLPEARFNRAVALVKVGKSAEARRALSPFASGVYGGYRREEARILLRGIDARGEPRSSGGAAATTGP